MKRMIAMLLLIVLLCGCAEQTIGTIRGAELEEIVIDGVVYAADPGDEHQAFSIADKGEYLGVVTNGNTEFRVYAVKGDTDRQYLYVLWDQEGNIYVRTE